MQEPPSGRPCLFDEVFPNFLVFGKAPRRQLRIDQGAVQEYWPRSLRFLTTDLANAAFTASNEEIAMLAAGITPEELRVENVILRIQANPTEPHGAVADFVLVRTRQERQVSREQWTATMQFVFMPVIPTDLVVVNPMGIQVTYLDTDRTLITETP